MMKKKLSFKYLENINTLNNYLKEYLESLIKNINYSKSVYGLSDYNKTIPSEIPQNTNIDIKKKNEINPVLCEESRKKDKNKKSKITISEIKSLLLETILENYICIKDGEILNKTKQKESNLDDEIKTKYK